MGDEWNEKMAMLKEAFEETEIEWRAARTGLKQDGVPWVQVLCYISARAAMNRLDEVLGPENWKVSYDHLTETQYKPAGVMCTLSVKCAGEWVPKADGSEYTDFETFKGGISSAFKRAANLWGIGRYLYDVGDSFGVVSKERKPGSQYGTAENKKNGEKVHFHWLPPKMPDWALPKKKEKSNVTSMEEAKEKFPFEKE